MLEKNVIISVVSHGQELEIDLVKELEITEDYDILLRRQAADYAYYATARANAYRIYKELLENDFAIWRSSAAEVAKGVLLAAGEKRPTIDGIDSKIKALFGTQQIVQNSAITYKAIVTNLKIKDPFSDFRYNNWQDWQNALRAAEQNFEYLKVLERAIEIRGYLLQTLCANKRAEEMFIDTSAIKVFDTQRKTLDEYSRKVALKQLAQDVSLQLNVGGKNK